MNADSHTCKIQHSSTGQQKTVHRNLITPVNFLPLHEAASEDRLSDMSESDDLSDDHVTEVEVDTSSRGAEYRTRVWVSALPSKGTCNDGPVPGT